MNTVFGNDDVTVTPADDKLRQYLSGKFEPKDDTLFTVIPALYSGKADVQYLRKEAIDGFKKMADEAKKDGVTLKIVSATRNFYSQKAIWEAKWNGTRTDWKDVATKYPAAVDRAKAILRYSSMPGTSRHHWGTDIDINSVEPDYFLTKKGKAEYDWLVKNAARFGFCQPYSPKGADRPNGYEEEKWHWSYMPLSKNFLSQYPTIVSYDDIRGFDGDVAAESLKVIDNYVLGVNVDCK
jgi:D-alanyl-D-alanine carboxypeptidase